jgi:nitrous oxide reductase accessory protein NosL
MRVMTAIFLIGLLAGSAAAAPAAGYVKPKDKDKCPVCGMFVYKYPDWVAEVLFKDGSYAVFDGAKDLFKYLLDPAGPGSRRRKEMTGIIVTDYYAVRPVDAEQAYYVIGSDTYGPMGRELVPFEREQDAREFLRDHQGKRVIRFRDVTPAVLRELD